MQHDSKPLVIGNWKMNPESKDEAKTLFREIQKHAEKIKTPAIIAVPAPYLGVLAEKASAYVTLGAQNVHSKRSGTYTGEISAPMLKSLGVTHVIVGHSERRAMGEADEDIAEKVKIVLQHAMTPVFCVGEHERDANGSYLGVVESQLRGGLARTFKKHIPNVVITYEPVWAISAGDGKGKTASPADAHEMKLFIQKILSDTYGRKTATATKIIYGGSVNASNAESLLVEGMVDGFLPGGASLKPKEFRSILETVHAHQ